MHRRGQVLVGTWKSIASLVGPVLVGAALLPELPWWGGLVLFVVGGTISALAGLYTKAPAWATAGPISNQAIVAVLSGITTLLISMEPTLIQMLPDVADPFVGVAIGIMTRLTAGAVPTIMGELTKDDVVKELSK